MNRDLGRLRPYPFQRLGRLLDGVRPTGDAAGLTPIRLSIGEPRHDPPPVALEALSAALATPEASVGRYPATRGTDALRAACAAWATRRYGLPEGALDAERCVLPCNGTREAIFALIQTVVDRTLQPVRGRPLVVIPDPFYQIYEGGALLAGAEPYYVPCRAEQGWAPDWDAVPEAIWARARLVILCTPHNPTGAVMDDAALARMLERSARHGFVVASDECYSEIYDDREGAAPPPGLLGACAKAGDDAFTRCVVFQSLSKRSSLPGLRSGFVAGDAALIGPFLEYRTYSGGAVPLHVQAASAVAWADEAHVRANRAAYQAKIDAVLPLLEPVLDAPRPAGGFFLWAGRRDAVDRRDRDDQALTRRLVAEAAVEVLPGSFLSRNDSLAGGNPGAGRLRLALVAPEATCVEAAQRIARCLQP